MRKFMRKSMDQARMFPTAHESAVEGTTDGTNQAQMVAKDNSS